MAVEVWVLALPNEVYRIASDTGAYIGKYTIPHAGSIMPAGTANVWFPDERNIFVTNGTGVAQTTPSGLASNKTMLGNRRPDAHNSNVMKIVSSEAWHMDPDGVVSRFTASDGTFLGYYNLGAITGGRSGGFIDFAEVTLS